jgi:thiosulfate/3-mercaptopyruvate sulfurtransferase
MAKKIAKLNFIVDARWLKRSIASKSLILIDTRPAADYWKSHIRGARHFDPFPFHHTDTTVRGVGEFNAQLEWIFSALGLGNRETVVFYEEDSGMRAARGVWMLDYAGHPRARMLDGGMRAALEANIKTDAAAVRVSPTRYQVRPRENALAPIDHVVKSLGRPDIQIFDVRSDAEYYSERVRARHGGAIAGAIHEDWTAAVGPNGSLKPAAELRAHYKSLGLDPKAEIITYCQGGYRAAHAYLALKGAGYAHVRNYLGSWAEWGNREDVPIDHPRRKG